MPSAKGVTITYFEGKYDVYRGESIHSYTINEELKQITVWFKDNVAPLLVTFGDEEYFNRSRYSLDQYFRG